MLLIYSFCALEKQTGVYILWNPSIIPFNFSAQIDSNFYIQAASVQEKKLNGYSPKGV